MRAAGVRNSALLVACGLAIFAGGCARGNVHAAAPVTAPPTPTLSETERPMTIAPDTDATPPVETAAQAAQPPVVAEEPAEPVNIPETKNTPAPRKPPEPVAEAAAEPPARPAAPLISPQLSPGDQASYERKTGEDIGVAEKNLQAAQGKRLNAVQQDLVDKIRNWVAQARDASKTCDWTRAQNLAQKARSLSIELTNSF
jgi:hypothetical protein